MIIPKVNKKRKLIHIGIKLGIWSIDLGKYVLYLSLFWKVICYVHMVVTSYIFFFYFFNSIIFFSFSNQLSIWWSWASSLWSCEVIKRFTFRKMPSYKSSIYSRFFFTRIRLVSIFFIRFRIWPKISVKALLTLMIIFKFSLKFRLVR